jgi:predicted dehydrogenase
MIKLGLIGCGAAMQALHLPAILQTPDVKVHWIVDPQIDKVIPIADRLKVPYLGVDYKDVRDVDAVIIGTPHFLHASMTAHFLEQGVHVLCEKPLALKASDASSLVTLAEQKRRVLAVGVFRRFYHVSGFMKQVIASEWLGPLVRMDVEEGGDYDWDLQSQFMMEKEKAGGGVLVDTGAHTVDRALWLLDADKVSIQRYADDNRGGIETDCELDLMVPWRGHDIPIHIGLSRTRFLKNTFEISFEHGRLVVPANHPSEARVYDERFSSGLNSFCVDTAKDFALPGKGPAPYFLLQFKAFCKAIHGSGGLINSGASVVACIQTIESCYEKREIMAESWSDVERVNSLVRLGEAL